MMSLDLYMLSGVLNHEMNLKSMYCGRNPLLGWDLYIIISGPLNHDVDL